MVPLPGAISSPKRNTRPPILLYDAPTFSLNALSLRQSDMMARLSSLGADAFFFPLWNM